MDMGLQQFKLYRVCQLRGNDPLLSEAKRCLTVEHSGFQASCHNIHALKFFVGNRADLLET
jgi:hypothetical protein